MDTLIQIARDCALTGAAISLAGAWWGIPLEAFIALALGLGSAAAIVGNLTDSAIISSAGAALLFATVPPCAAYVARLAGRWRLTEAAPQQDATQ